MKKKILIIEDQAPMRRNIALLLEIAGYQVFVAENGRVGVDAARAHHPDLILCDVMMPELDGYGVARALRAETAFAATPFIFLTAKGDRSDIRAGMNAGADDYLTKPVPREELMAAIDCRLRRAEAIEQRIQEAASSAGFHPDFSSSVPLQSAFGLTPREAEVLLWVAQGKSNSEIATILGNSEPTVKQHLGVVFQKIGVESRNAATLRALEVLGAPRNQDTSQTSS
ncbi:MAG: response regulator transcription factor [Verrucomicrobia bacterium]|nr:response regulator transcription factor [Verrucomicrobiota bacterium]MBI3869184.1 response regulator transcription factor [Verrucomicrobiota bacterium]